MTIRPLGANVTEVKLGDSRQCPHNYDVRVLFSYSTPVAYSVLTEAGRLYYRTKQFYSRTTSKHINAWLPKDQAEEVEQSVIDAVANGEGH